MSTRVYHHMLRLPLDNILADALPAAVIPAPATAIPLAATPVALPAPIQEAPVVPDDVTAAYLQKFESVADRVADARELIDSFSAQQDQGQRLAVVMKFVRARQVLNEVMYDLLVEMSDYLGNK